MFYVLYMFYVVETIIACNFRLNPKSFLLLYVSSSFYPPLHFIFQLCILILSDMVSVLASIQKQNSFEYCR